MKLVRMLGGMLVVATLMCSGNLCISASKQDGKIPYSSTTVTLLIEVLKLVVMLTAIDNNLNYVILRYMDAPRSPCCGTSRSWSRLCSSASYSNTRCRSCAKPPSCC
ncbi:hypothetical protein GQ600_11888 [Phytophthora cactorum]|nr:hypothetical protein GQ600_11888 [Phytophthora cactorum]